MESWINNADKIMENLDKDKIWCSWNVKGQLCWVCLPVMCGLACCCSVLCSPVWCWKACTTRDIQPLGYIPTDYIYHMTSGEMVLFIGLIDRVQKKMMEISVKSQYVLVDKVVSRMVDKPGITPAIATQELVNLRNTCENNIKKKQ